MRYSVERARMGENKNLKKKSLAKLREQHRRLDQEISRIEKSGGFDQIEVQRLKKRKLVLKDNISRLESKLLPDIIA